MKPCPAILVGTAWEGWIRDAPEVERGKSVDDYLKSAKAWLGDRPGHNAKPNQAESEALADWIESYQIDLIRGKNEEPGLNDDRLQIAFWSLVSGVAGLTIWKKLALAALLPAPAAVGLGIGLITMGYVTVAVRKASFKARRWRMLDSIDMALERVKRAKPT